MPPSQSTLSEQDIAALAAGLAAKPEEVDAEAARAAAETEAARVAAAEAAAEADTGTPVEKPESELVAFLRAELAAANIKITEAAVARTALEGKLATVEATHCGLLDIARGSVGTLRVALGGSAGNAVTLGAVEVVGEHKTLSEAFKAKFKVGGVAATTADAPSQDKSAVDAARIARIAATKTA